MSEYEPLPEERLARIERKIDWLETALRDIAGGLKTVAALFHISAVASLARRIEDRDTERGGK